MDSLRRDLRYGIKTILRRPVANAAAVLCLALGIGATTVVFSLFNGVLLKALPYRDSSGIQVLRLNLPAGPSAASGKEFEDFQQLSDTFEHVGGMIGWSYNVTDVDPPQRISAGRVSSSIFDVLGVAPFMGRVYTAEEQNRGDNLVVLSYGLWQSAFGGDQEILGRTITLSETPFTVIGVMPSDFRPMPPSAQLWVPLIPNPAIPRNLRGVTVLVRLKDGISVTRAKADLEVVKQRFEADYPDIYNTEWSLGLLPLRNMVVGNVGARLWAFMGAVFLVLAIACANVANLLLAQATAREKEMALRAAFGAGRGTLVRQMLTESLILAVAGGGLGLALSYVGINVVKRFQLGSIPRLAEVTIDLVPLLFTFLITFATGLIFGLAPALKVSGKRFANTLKEGGKTSSSGRRHPLRSALVIAEIALAVVVLIGTVLTLRSFNRLQDVDPGFQVDDLVSMQVLLPRPAYARPADRLRFHEGFEERLNAQPGIESAAVMSYAPFGPLSWTGQLQIDGQDPNDPGPSVNWNMVSPKVFDTLKVPLLQGRSFTNLDLVDSTEVAVVDESTAERLWPDENPLGKRIMPVGAQYGSWREVVGVVGDVKQSGLASATTQIYLPYPQYPNPVYGLVLRTQLDTRASVDAVRGVVSSLDARLPISRIARVDSLLAASLAGPRFNLVLFGIFGGIAFVLAAVGIYGIMASSVAERTTEIGVRRAMGARTGDVLRLVLGEGMMLTGLGLAIGLVAAWLLTHTVSRILSGLVFGIATTDVLSFVTVTLFLLLVALLGSLLPARRAIRVDPVVALRSE